METLDRKTPKNVIQATDNEFNWEDFFKNYWEKEPVLYRNPFGKAVLSKEDIFDTLVACGNAIRNNINKEVTFYDQDRVHISGKTTSTRYLTGLEHLLPSGKEGNLDTYCASLSKHDRFKEFCIYLEKPHTFSSIWLSLRKFFATIAQYTELPAVSMGTDMFIGNYATTSFGAHKDNLDNFMFMLFGGRKMLLWHDDVWKYQLGNPNDDSYTTTAYEAFRPEALVFDLQEGDLLYWPSSYWHVGENDGSLSGSINIDYFHPRADHKLGLIISSTIKNLVENSAINSKEQYGLKSLKFNPDHYGKVHLPEHYDEVLSSTITQLTDKENNELFLHYEWLRVLSGYGFSKTIPRREHRKFSEEDHICINKHHPILYTSLHNKLLVAHTGHVKLLPEQFAYEELIKKLNTGIVYNVHKLYASTLHEHMDFESFVKLLSHLHSMYAINCK